MKKSASHVCSVIPSRGPAAKCIICKQPLHHATHEVTPPPAPAPAFSLSTFSNAWRRREDEKAVARYHVGIFLRVGTVERALPSVAAGVKAFLAANTGEDRVVLIHRVWLGAADFNSKSARLVSATVLQETANFAAGMVL